MYRHALIGPGLVVATSIGCQATPDTTPTPATIAALPLGAGDPLGEEVFEHWFEAAGVLATIEQAPAPEGDVEPADAAPTIPPMYLCVSVPPWLSL